MGIRRRDFIPRNDCNRDKGTVAIGGGRKIIATVRMLPHEIYRHPQGSERHSLLQGEGNKVRES